MIGTSSRIQYDKRETDATRKQAVDPLVYNLNGLSTNNCKNCVPRDSTIQNNKFTGEKITNIENYLLDINQPLNRNDYNSSDDPQGEFNKLADESKPVDDCNEETTDFLESQYSLLTHPRIFSREATFDVFHDIHGNNPQCVDKRTLGIGEQSRKIAQQAYLQKISEKGVR